MEMWIEEGGTLRLASEGNHIKAECRDEGGVLCETLGAEAINDALDGLDEGARLWVEDVVA